MPYGLAEQSAAQTTVAACNGRNKQPFDTPIINIRNRFKPD